MSHIRELNQAKHRSALARGHEMEAQYRKGGTYRQLGAAHGLSGDRIRQLVERHNAAADCPLCQESKP